jgi:hypothetical protein
MQMKLDDDKGNDKKSGGRRLKQEDSNLSNADSSLQKYK